MNFNFKYKFKPRFTDIDSYGIAHHSKYLCWFEEARFFFLESIMGLTSDNVIGYRFPVVRLEVNYKKPIKFGEYYIILSTLKCNYDKAKIKFEYKILDLLEKELLSDGYTEHVFLSEKGELLLNIPDIITEKLKLVEKRMVSNL